MARYGSWRPLADNWAAQPKMSAFDIICLHTMVGSLTGTETYFRQQGYGGTESHFGVGADGTVYQWQDTARQADANYRGNHRIISIETADVGTGFSKWNTNDGNAVPAWTDEQMNALARLLAFLCREHKIPCEPVPDSKPGWRGIAYHRQGVDPWRVAGGEQWSTARGKVCPGPRRIAQIPRLIDAARQHLGGQEDDMPLSDKDLDAIADRVWERARKNGFGHIVGPIQVLNGTEKRLASTEAKLDKLEERIVRLTDQ